ncbi:MAG: RsmD family RNA methyltransferase, partial [Lachnospiraceae bacterium]|nr:RsmD family RNA methyltransferase [Lachnospiraceae bacterium]
MYENYGEKIERSQYKFWFDAYTSKEYVETNEKWQSLVDKLTTGTDDKTKETLFNVLAPFIFSDTRFLDLFAGSGGIGIEAVSRGAEAAVLVESGREAARCIEENIRICRFEDR